MRAGPSRAAPRSAAGAATPQGLAGRSPTDPGVAGTADRPAATAQRVHCLDLDADGAEEPVNHAQASLLRRSWRTAATLLLPAAAAMTLTPQVAAVPSGAAGVTLRSETARVVRGDLAAVRASLSDDGDSDGDGLADWHYSGHGEARWSFTAGVLRIGADLGMSTSRVPVRQGSFTAHAFALVTDRVQVWSPSMPAAAPMVLRMALNISHQFWPCDACSIAGGAQWLEPLGGATVSVSAGGRGAPGGGVQRSDAHWQGFSHIATFEVLNGLDFDLGIRLDLAIVTDHVAAGQRGWDLHSTRGRLDYLHTLTVSAIDIGDAGLAVADAQLLSSGGGAWLATPVPEPPAALLGAVGLVTLRVWRRHQRRR